MNNLHDDFEDIEDDFDESANDEENNKDEMTAAEAEFRIKELYQPPLTNLVNHPEILPLFSIIFQSCPSTNQFMDGIFFYQHQYQKKHTKFHYR